MAFLLFMKDFQTPYDQHFESYGSRSYKDAIKDCVRKIQKDPHNGELLVCDVLMKEWTFTDEI